MMLTGAELGAPGSILALQDGEGTVRVQPISGIVDIWTKRVPCLERNEAACIESEASTSFKSPEIAGGMLTIAHGDQGAGFTWINATDGTIAFASESVELGLDGGTTATFSSDQEAPQRFARTSSPPGIVAATEQGVDATLDGGMELRTVDTRVTVRESNGEEQSFETGWRWESGTDFPAYRVLTLIHAEIVGQGSALSDGEGALFSGPPVGIQATSAELVLVDGSLDESQAPGAMTLSDAEFAIRDVDMEEGTFQITESDAPVAVPEDPAEEELSNTLLIGVGAAAVASIGAVGYYWPRLSWGGAALLFPMYSRIEKDELFENEVRETLYELIQDNPGIHAHGLSEEADVGWGTTVYHLRRLERNGFVNSERRGRYRRFFPAAGFMARQREVLSVLQNETTNDIARLVLRKPGLNQSAICEELDISPSLANWHLNRLLDAELIERERRGRTVHYTPGEAWKDVEDALDPDVQAALEGASA